jgi:hypothetical protein
MYAREEYALVPLSLDYAGEPVHGPATAWESSDPRVADVATNGSITALSAGRCIVTVSVGQKKARAMVEVREGQRPLLTNARWDSEHGGDCNDPEDESEPSVIEERATAGAASRRINPALIFDPDDPTNKPDAAKPFNATGHPRFTPNLEAQASPAGTDDQLGSYNFSLAIPIFGLSGRGVSAGLALIYNSRMWTKNNNEIVFDYDQGWPAPGFRLNYGRIIPNYDVASGASGNYLLIQADGTRISLARVPGTAKYRSDDGQYFEFDSSTNKLQYPDGTEVVYAFNSNKLLPNSIRDINGNSIAISYVTSCSDAQRVEPCACGSACQKPPRQAINYITDTLGRQVTFHYYANGNLAEIRVPGYNGASSRTVAKFYYQPITLSYNFGSMSVQNVPSGNQVDVLKRVFFPDTGRGYVFDSYSGYGMCTKISMQLGMTDSLEGTNVAYSEYVHQTSGTLSDAPQFTERREWWQGKTDDNGNLQGPTLYASYFYSRTTDSAAKTMTNTVTAPDGTQSQMISNDDSASFEYGLLKTMKVVNGSATPVQQDYSYGTSTAQGGLQRTRIDVTPDNVSTSKTRVESLYSSYGRLEEAIEYGFQTSGSFKKRRRTVYSYFEGGSSYTDKGLVRLVEQVRVYDAKQTNDNTDDTVIARTKYVYDCADCATPDPDWGLENYGYTDNCAPTSNPPCAPPPGFNTNFVGRTSRGNVTKVQFYSQASSATPDIEFRHRYDIFGNEVKAELGCCSLQQMTFNSTMYWSLPVSVTKGGASGPQLASSFIFDFNTSFLKSQTDPNNHVTSFAPDAAMRLLTVTYPKLASDSNPNPIKSQSY